MKKEQYKTFGKHDYCCKQLDGYAGIGLFFEMTQLLGDPALVMISRAFSDKEVGDHDGGEIVGAGMFTFLSKLQPDTGKRIMQIAFAEVSCGKVNLGEEKEFNLHFKGETLRALEVFAWAMQVNFASFLEDSRLSAGLSGLKAMVGAAGKKAYNRATSQDPSPPSASMQTGAQTSETSL